MPRKEIDTPVDPDILRLWTKLLDPKRTSIEEFCEAYKVPTKRPGLFKGKTLVRFKAYPLQLTILKSIEWQWTAGTGGKIIGGKGRQEGLTVRAALLFWERFMRGGGGTWNLFSYDDDAVKELFRLLWSFRKQTPPEVFTKILRGGGKWVKSSAKQLELEFKDGEQNSMLQCLTAGGKHSGSGSAPRGILWDEFSKWTDEAKADPSGMSEGWADVPGNLWIIQGTGQGQEGFAQRFQTIWGGGEEAKESGFVAVFRPWLGHPDRTEAMSAEETDRFMRTVGKVARFGIEEERALVKAGATPGELKWRRTKVSSPAFNYNLKLFAREYPLVPDDMFIDASRTIFTESLPVIRSYIVVSRDRDRDSPRGFLDTRGDETIFNEDPSGPWIVYEKPSDETFYVFGVDPTSGKTKDDVNKGEPDFAVITMDEAWTGRTVALYHGHTEGKVLGDELFNACCWYKGKEKIGAWGFVENNTFGLSTILRMCESFRGDIGGRDLLLKIDRGMAMNARFWNDSDLGFPTFKESRELMIDWLREYLVEVPVWTPGAPCVLSHRFISEALLFERNPKTAKPEARMGKDDTVISKGLAVAARREVFRLGLVDTKSKVKIKVPVEYDPIGAYFRQEMEAAEKRKRRGQSMLGSGYA